MFRWSFLLLLVILNTSAYAKEWKNLKTYQKATNQNTITASHWLKTDRVNNTLVWQNANVYNLKHNGFQEYENIQQRRDFYKWLYTLLDKKGHEVNWVQMAHYISEKMRLFDAFPYTLFFNKDIKQYVYLGNKTVFNNAFPKLRALHKSPIILKGKDAENWDCDILKEEQYNWIQEVYKVMDIKSLKTLKRIAKGQGLYSLVVPKSVRFTGELANPEDRYHYAIKVLKPYCKNRYKS
ncbi:MAG: Insecticidal toxin complex protein [Algibacter sp.]|uniref:Insecticidal toxin complex protein n=1 Tax=Algibacter sp. TaxID=1872428 RepID=UPI0032971DCB